jgi:hypothetical protein
MKKINLFFLSCAYLFFCAALFSFSGKESNFPSPKDYLSDEGIRQLGAGAKGLSPDGHELANHFIKYLAQGNPVDVAAFDKTAQTTYQKEKANVERLMKHQVSLLGGYELQDLGDPIDWFRAPKNDLQWPTHLSRHYWLKPLVHAWRATKDTVYSGEVVRVLLDWVEKTPIGTPDLYWHNEKQAKEKGAGFVPEGFFPSYVDGPWTSLSAHSRVDTWTYLLAMLYDAPQMNNKNLDILFNSLANDHRKSMLSHPRAMNQFIAIATSLVNYSWHYPFLKGASESNRTGLERVRFFANSEIYPDGSMAECSPNYSIGSLERVSKIVRDDQTKGGNMYGELDERICKAMRYFAFTADPQGNSPRIAKGKKSALPLAKELNKVCGDPEVEYVLSSGKTGTEPSFKSIAYDWAGHMVFRSGWDKGATWLFFEPGPRGSGHSDMAFLNIQLQSKGEVLLADPGYYSYSSQGEEGEMSAYLRSTGAHNTGVVNGQGQIAVPTGEKRGYNTSPGNYGWKDNGKLAQATGSYMFGYGENGAIKVTHKRKIVYHRDEDKFVIKDSFEGEGGHRVALHWQITPRAKLTVGEKGMAIENGKASAQIGFSCNHAFSVNPVKAGKDTLLGWYSEGYGELEPAHTVQVTANASLPVHFETTIKIK